jgi:hypothetical protein
MLKKACKTFERGLVTAQIELFIDTSYSFKLDDIRLNKITKSMKVARARCLIPFIGVFSIFTQLVSSFMYLLIFNFYVQVVFTRTISLMTDMVPYVTMKYSSLVSFVQPILLVVVLVCNSPPSATAWEDPQVEWLRSKPNGYFSDKISFQKLDPNDPTSSYGMFAFEDIKKDERLIVIPQGALVTSRGTDLNCDTVTMLLEELEKGKDSDYYPYINYMFGDETKRDNMPVAWSELGQILLEELIGANLPPEKFKNHKIEKFCREVPEDVKNVSQLEQDAYLFMISRSWDDVMIPGKIYSQK